MNMRKFVWTEGTKRALGFFFEIAFVAGVLYWWTGGK